MMQNVWKFPHQHSTYWSKKHCFGSHFGLQAFKFDSQVYLVRHPNTSLNRIEIHVCLFSSSSPVRKLITSSNSHIIRCFISPSQDNDGQLLLYTIVNANLFSCVTGAIELQSTHDDDIIITNLLMLYSNPLRLMGSQIHLFIHSLLIQTAQPTNVKPTVHHNTECLWNIRPKCSLPWKSV